MLDSPGRNRVVRIVAHGTILSRPWCLFMIREDDLWVETGKQYLALSADTSGPNPSVALTE
jgi:hypothetical protein